MTDFISMCWSLCFRHAPQYTASESAEDSLADPAHRESQAFEEAVAQTQAHALPFLICTIQAQV